MKMKFVCSVALLAMMVVPAIAEDAVKEKKGKGQGNRQGQVAKMLIKQLEPVGLTEEQTAKITELGKVTATQLDEIRKSAGITPELNKKFMEARKSLRASGKKGKELIAAINEEAGLTEDQAAAMKKINQAQMEFQQKAVALLTDEQKEKLPERLQKPAKGEKGKGKGKKKEAA
jgi:Spy/CpxP family protein refolding chaperone